MTRHSIGPKVTEQYFGMNLADGQSADEPYDPASRIKSKDGVFMTGRGSQGGGSKPTHQAHRPGSGRIASSYPKQSQKIRR
jgi:hypothetical protein